MFANWRSRARSYLHSNLVTCVLGALSVIWLVVSAAVYLAERGVQDSNIKSFGDSIWWGVVTLLTVGYGDKYPITTEGRFWAGGLMFAGVFAVAIVTSKISQFFMEQALREGKGMVNGAALKGHLVVCGWKDEMHELLSHVLDFNPEIDSEQVVLVANIGPQVVDSLKLHPRLKKLNVVVGNYYEASMLKRAVPERAKKVIILADRTPMPNGAAPSMTETDARTIMTAMTLSSIARGTLVVAEIIDPKMDQYLKLAAVSEIIYTRECSRLMLGNAAGGTGVSNIIFDLLDPKTGARLTTHPIAETELRQSFSKFKAAFEARKPSSIVIGILENTGNSHSIKEQALRNAQKTTDVNRLLENLRSVKELRCNHPVFNPPKDYMIPEGSMAILLETQQEEVRAHAA